MKALVVLHNLHLLFGNAYKNQPISTIQDKREKRKKAMRNHYRKKNDFDKYVEKSMLNYAENVKVKRKMIT